MRFLTPMGQQLTLRFQSALRRLGLLLAIAALICQFSAVGRAVAMELPDAAVQAVAAIGVICHVGGQPGASRDHAPSHHHGGDCLECPLCQSVFSPAAMLAPALSFPRPGLVATIRRQARPPSAAPPGTIVGVAWPRGPPTTL